MTFLLRRHPVWAEKQSSAKECPCLGRVLPYLIHVMWLIHGLLFYQPLYFFKYLLSLCKEMSHKMFPAIWQEVDTSYDWLCSVEPLLDSHCFWWPPPHPRPPNLSTAKLLHNKITSPGWPPLHGQPLCSKMTEHNSVTTIPVYMYTYFQVPVQHVDYVLLLTPVLTVFMRICSCSIVGGEKRKCVVCNTKFLQFPENLSNTVV